MKKLLLHLVLIGVGVLLAFVLVVILKKPLVNLFAFVVGYSCLTTSITDLVHFLGGDKNDKI